VEYVSRKQKLDNEEMLMACSQPCHNGTACYGKWFLFSLFTLADRMLTGENIKRKNFN